MKISKELFERAKAAAMESDVAAVGISITTDRALLAFLAALDVEIADESAPYLWTARTWVDVRRGDVVRMPGQEATAAEVMELATLGWHVNDRPPAQKEGESDEAYAKRVDAFNRDVQYRPNEHAGEWTARPVTLRPLAADDPATRHRIPNVNPSAPVEIRLTQVEVDAIELLGGWAMRVQ